MRKRRLRRFFVAVIAITYWCSTVASIILAAIGRVDRNWLATRADWALPTYDFLTGIMPLALPIAVILLAVTSQTRQHLLPSRIDLAVKKLLDDFRTLALPADDPQVIPQVAAAT